MPTPGSSTAIYSTSLTTANPKYETNNSEIVAILMDLERFPNNLASPNFGHIKNPQHKGYLTAGLVGDTKSPGVGQDGVYRDPWGNPYIITLDLNYDQKTRDAFYRIQTVSEDAASAFNPKPGLNGLIRGTDGAGKTIFEATSPVTVWSAGPDKMIDPNADALHGANKDNVLSWKQ
jgi:hypothetical protein